MSPIRFGSLTALGQLGLTGNLTKDQLKDKKLLELLERYGLDKYLLGGTSTNPDLDLSGLSVDSIFKQNYETTGDTKLDESIIDMLNDIVNNEDITKKMKVEGGEFDEEYIDEFLALVSQYDDDGGSISIEDIAYALQDIENGNFSLSSTSDDAQEELPDVSDTESTPEVDDTPSTGGSPDVGSNNPPKDTSGDNTDNVPENTDAGTKNLAGMSKAELQSELQSANAQLTEHQAQLDSALNGTSPEIQALQKTADDAYEQYLEQVKSVDEDLAKELDTAVTNVSDKETEISNKESEISAQESTVSSADSAYKSAVSNRKAIDDQLAHLRSIDTSGLEEAEATHIQTQISALVTEQTNAVAEEARKKTELETAQKELEKLQKDKETLDGELVVLNKTKSDIEAKIIEQAPQIQTFKTAYDTAKTAVETAKTTAVTEAKSLLEKDRAYVTEIEAAIANCENNEMRSKFSDGLLRTNVPTEPIPLTQTLDEYQPEVEMLGHKDPSLLNLYEETEVADSNPFEGGKNAETKAKIDDTLKDLNVTGDISYKRLSDGTYVVSATSTLDLNHKVQDGSKYVSDLDDVPTTSYYKLNEQGELIGYQSPAGTFEYDEQGDLHLKYKGEQSYYMDLKLDTPLYLDDIVRQVTQPKNNADIEQLMYVFYGHYEKNHENGCQVQVAHAYDTGLGLDCANKGDVALYNSTAKDDTTNIDAGDIIYSADNNYELTASGHARHEGIYFYNIPLNNGLTLAISGDFAKNHVQTSARFIQPGVEGNGGKNGTNAMMFRYHHGKEEIIFYRKALRTLDVLD